MQIKEKTYREYYKILTVIHSVQLIGHVIILVIFYYINSTKQLSTDSKSLNDIFNILVPLSIIGGLFISSFLTKNNQKKIKKKSKLKDKLEEYQSSLLKKYALLGGLIFFALMGFLLTGNFLFLGLAGLIILVFILNRPSRHRTIKDLELNENEKQLIEDPKSIVT